MKNARDVLLELICAAPDPCGFEKSIPHYQKTWDDSRAYLRATCSEHVIDGSGTCPNCHGDTDGDKP